MKGRRIMDTKALRKRLASMTNKDLIVWDSVLTHIACITDEFSTLGISGEPPSPSVPTLIRELRLEFKRRTNVKSTHELAVEKGGHENGKNSNGH